MTNKADKDHWNQLHANASLKIASKTDNIRLWIERFVPRAKNNSDSTCIEIGCCPGRYLAVLGELGYEVNGVDLADNIKTMPVWLASQNYRVGNFWQENFLDFDFKRRFAVVMSLGFIEHFTNWREVLIRHCDLVSTDGYLVVEAPNFIGRFQNWLHRTLDSESYARHHVPAMDIDAWAEILQAQGFGIVHKGYFGTFDFWVEDQPRTLGQRFILKALHRCKRLLKWLLPPDRKMYSPVGGIIAKRMT